MPTPDVLAVDTDRIYSLANATSIQGQIEARLRAPGCAGLLLDLSRVDYAASPFLAVLVASRKLAVERKVPFAVVGMKSVVKGLFGLVKLDTLIPMYDDVAAAKSALASGKA
jgi:anti-anti-sigma factor